MVKKSSLFTYFLDFPGNQTVGCFRNERMLDEDGRLV